MAEKAEDTVAPKGNPRVFVYGSLKQDHSNHRLLENYNFLGYAYIDGPFRMMTLGFFPGVVELPYDDKDGLPEFQRIYGEVWVVDEQGLASLDLLEGHPNFYERKKLKTNVEEFGNVWCYFLQSDFIPEKLVKDGMWKPTIDEALFWQKENTDGAKSGDQAA